MRLGGKYRFTGGCEWSAPRIGERDAVGIVGIARDAQLASVVQPVMSAAQRHQVRGVGGPAVFPVHHMVNV